MPVEFRPIDPPTTWQMFPRHPAGSDHKDLPPALAKKMRDGIERFGILLRPVVLKREHGGLYVLDGWQMYQGCIATGVRPEFVELVGGIEPDDFVRLKNDCRRHETDADISERLKARRRRLRAMVDAGVSVTRAARKEGISRITAHKDLNALPPRCETCERKGESGDECGLCLMLRINWKPPQPKKLPKPTPEDRNVAVVELAREIARLSAALNAASRKFARFVKAAKSEIAVLSESALDNGS